MFDEMLNSTFFARPPESDIGVTNRNVATSRLANALGIGDVVVQSELATLQGSGESPMSGILMQKAPGKSALDALDEDYGEEALDTPIHALFSASSNQPCPMSGVCFPLSFSIR